MSLAVFLNSCIAFNTSYFTGAILVGVNGGQQCFKSAWKASQWADDPRLNFKVWIPYFRKVYELGSSRTVEIKNGDLQIADLNELTKCSLWKNVQFRKLLWSSIIRKLYLNTDRWKSALRCSKKVTFCEVCCSPGRGFLRNLKEIRFLGLDGEKREMILALPQHNLRPGTNYSGLLLRRLSVKTFSILARSR